MARIQPDANLAPGWPAGGLPLGSSAVPWQPHLLEDGAGGVFALWSSLGPGYTVMLQHVAPGATIVTGWPAGGLPLFQGSAPIPDLLPMIASGNEHIYAAGCDSTDDVIWLMRVGHDGSAAAGWEGGPYAVQVAGSFDNVEVVPDGEDGAYVAWRTPADVRALRVLPDGSLASGWPAGGKSVLDAAAVMGDEFHIAHGASGGLVLAWEDHRHPSRRFVRARWLLGDGSADPAQPDSGRVVSAGALLADAKGVVPDGSGGVFVAWNEDLFDMYAVTPSWLSWAPYPIPLDVAPAPRAASLRMSAPRPNPAPRAVAFTVTLPDDSPARAELVDLAGRRVRAEDLHGAGEHHVRFGDVGALPAGVYFVRVSQGNRSVSDRVAIVH